MRRRKRSEGKADKERRSVGEDRNEKKEEQEEN